MVFVYLIVAVVMLFAYFYANMKKKLCYWKIIGVEHPEPLPFFGNSFPIFLKKQSLSDVSTDAYKKYPNEKMVGIFDFITPTLVIRDPKLLEKILVKDFHYFTDHGLDNQSGDLFSYTLFQMPGDRWRSVRYKMAPTFTSGKLKFMFDQMLVCSEEMIKTIRQDVTQDYEIKNPLSTYSMDIVSDVVFGVQFKNCEAKKEFIDMSSSIFNTSPLQFLNMFFLLHFPKLANKMGITFATKKIDHYFRNIILDTIHQRSNDAFQRNDYLHLLLKLKEKGSTEVISKEIEDSYLNLDGKPPGSTVEMTDDLLAGQIFQFLTAGLDPIFLSMMYTMYELAKNTKIQERLREEIKKSLNNNGGKYSYQSIKEMTYLEQCIQESLRLHPIAPVLFRQCTKSYYTEDGIELEKGLKLIIPVMALHMDSQYYQNPELFNPDRFAKDATLKNFTYLPFGNGPRICLGFRFAMIVMKLGLAKIIENFTFTLSPNTIEPLDYNTLAFITVTTSKILFNLTPVM